MPPSRSGVMRMRQHKENVLTSNEAMRLTGYRSRSAFWGAVRREGIPHVRVTSKHIVFPAVAFERWLDSRTIGGVR